MIVCVCKNVNTASIRESLESGMTLEEISSNLGLGTGCGQCLAFAEELVEEEKEAMLIKTQVA